MNCSRVVRATSFTESEFGVIEEVSNADITKAEVLPISPKVIIAAIRTSSLLGEDRISISGLIAGDAISPDWANAIEARAINSSGDPESARINSSIALSQDFPVKKGHMRLRNDVVGYHSEEYRPNHFQPKDL